MSNRLTFDQIVDIMAQRRVTDSALKQAMQQISDRYNGDVVIPLPDVDGEPTLAQPTPNLIADSIDHVAMRAASTTPIIYTPALRPTIESSRAKAHSRRRFLYATWDHSGLIEMILPRTYRHLTGYGTNCKVVTPDFEHRRPRIEIRNPLNQYPEYRAPDDVREPLNNGSIYPRSPQWICRKYPEARQFFDGILARINRKSPSAASGFWDSVWDVVEWIDEHQIVMGILGSRSFGELLNSNHPLDPAMSSTFHLRTWDNRAGMVPVAIPRRITLDRIDGQVSKLTGIIDMQGKLMALDVLAAEKAIFPDMVVISKDGTPQLLNASGRWNDGRTGEVNLLKADTVSLLQSAPGPLTHPVIDRLEQNFRLSAGMPGFAQGQNSNGLRTGNALATMEGISIDPRVLEAQRLEARSLKVCNEAAVEIQKGYFAGRHVFFSGWPGDTGHVELSTDDLDSVENAVQYAFPGTDINQLTVAIGNAAGIGLISKKSGRAKHPLVDDPDAEERHILTEQMEEVGMAAFFAQVQAGQLPLIDWVEIVEAYERSGSLAAAVRKADQLARERQAAAVPPTDPAAQPGLSVPGMGAESGGGMAAPSSRIQEFEQIVQALNQGSNPPTIGVPTA